MTGNGKRQVSKIKKRKLSLYKAFPNQQKFKELIRNFQNTKLVKDNHIPENEQYNQITINKINNRDGITNKKY